MIFLAQMGNSEGKEIGQWFGPNTIAQVLRRIASHELDKQINVHVAMDNTLVLDAIRKFLSSVKPNR
jgi:cysteine protease ATG4